MTSSEDQKPAEKVTSEPRAAESGESKWHLRLAVISTIATVLALVIPFLLPNNSDSKPDGPTEVLEDVKKDLKDLKKSGPPKFPPFPKK